MRKVLFELVAKLSDDSSGYLALQICSSCLWIFACHLAFLQEILWLLKNNVLVNAKLDSILRSLL